LFVTEFFGQVLDVQLRFRRLECIQVKDLCSRQHSERGKHMQNRFQRLRNPLAVGVIMTALALGAIACAPPRPSAVQAQAPAYTGQDRALTITMVPLLTNEMQGTFDYLQQDFAPGGVLDGQEVYGFDPSTMIVYAGDTLDLTLINPSNDPHTFTVPELGVNIPVAAQSQVTGKFPVGQPGLFNYLCIVPEHIKHMRGQIVVLPASAAPVPAGLAQNQTP
jgi:plastocyanin